MKQINGSHYSNPFSLIRKTNYFLVKFVVFFLLLGFAYRFYFSSVPSISPDHDVGSDTAFPVDKTPPYPAPVYLDEDVGFDTAFLVDDTSPDISPVFGDLSINENLTSVDEKCDIFIGDWVPDPTAPSYTNETCFSIEEHQNCMKNGRPDKGYIYWKWKPRDCELPKFDPHRFLNMMRDKSFAFIGDSISRNHVQSLLCILSQGEKAVEIYHDKEYKSKKWLFPVYNFTLSVIWTPFLVKAVIFEDNDGVSTGAIRLNLDELDPVWTEQYGDLDYLVIAGGKWFLKMAYYYENNSVSGCHNCQGKNVTELGFEYAYRKTLKSVFDFINRSNHEAYIFLRTSTPDHFENGEWNTGGYCNRTGPYKDREIELIDVDRVMREIELEEFGKATFGGFENGSKLKLFDTTGLSLMRPDGHPGVYRHFHPFEGKNGNVKVQNDCLHWCLPGPIDSWNDLMMQMLLSS